MFIRRLISATVCSFSIERNRSTLFVPLLKLGFPLNTEFQKTTIDKIYIIEGAYLEMTFTFLFERYQCLFCIQYSRIMCINITEIFDGIIVNVISFAYNEYI